MDETPWAGGSGAAVTTLWVDAKWQQSSQLAEQMAVCSVQCSLGVWWRAVDVPTSNF